MLVFNRKLYVEAFTLLILGISFVFKVQPKLSENIGQISSCLIELLIAVLANRFYYSSIKGKIQQGYHLCIVYKPTSYLLGILSLLCMITFFMAGFTSNIINILWKNLSHNENIFTILFFITFSLTFIMTCIFWYRDKVKVEQFTQNMPNFSRDINSENIAKLI